MRHTLKKARRTMHRGWKSFARFVRNHWKTVILGGIALLLLIIGGFFVWLASQELPTLESFADRKIEESTKIYDRTGEVVLYDVHENVRRTLIDGDEISAYVKNAVVAVEDDEFYEHKGVDVRATFRGITLTILTKLGLRDGNIQGGSTITQQVVKNTLLTSERKVSRKMKEWYLSVKLEQQLTKDEILTQYLNVAPYGGTIYGIEEASRSFFGKPAMDLTIAEAAYLAALPNAPSFFSPYGPNRDKLENRKNFTLRRMYDLGFITPEEYETARKEQVEFRPQKDNYAKALHFVQYVRAYLEEKYGQDTIQNEGLRVITTLDYELQQKAEDIVRENAIENEAQWNAKNQGVIALDPNTGEILVMVGSRDYFDTEIDGNYNVTLAKRQPGSSFKPFVYASALAMGYTDETVLFDVRTQFSASCNAFNFTSTQPCYSPQNYNGEYPGPVTLRDALGQSRNVPAVKLLYLVGIENALANAKRLGLSTLDRNANRYGLTLVLGGGEVTLLDMTSAYGVFATGGVRNAPIGILRVEDSRGNVLEEFTPNPVQVFDRNAVAQLNDILDDDEARVGLFGSIYNFMYFGDRPVAAKTGTTNDNKDAWLLGYTPQIAVGVWTGNNDNASMTRGSAISASTWRSLMDEILASKPIAYFDEPIEEQDYDALKPILRGEWQGGEVVRIDTISEKLATEYTPEETIREVVIPGAHTILHWVNRADPRGPAPENPEADNQYKNWEATVQAWMAENSEATSGTLLNIPTEYDDVHTADSAVDITITEPTAGTHGASDTITVRIDTDADYPIDEVRYFLNDIFIGSKKSSPFVFSFEPQDFAYTQTSILKAVVYDTARNSGEDSFEITITQ